jgi:hypothetical protein
LGWVKWCLFAIGGNVHELGFFNVFFIFTLELGAFMFDFLFVAKHHVTFVVHFGVALTTSGNAYNKLVFFIVLHFKIGSFDMWCLLYN